MTSAGHPIERLPIAANGLVFDALACGPADGALVLFLHGFPQFADAWGPIMLRVAAAGYRALAFDQRGYSPGARPRKTAAYRLDALIADALAVGAQAGAARFHLVGHDWGGIVGWALAARHGERLRSLTILSTPHVDAFLDAKRTDPDQRRKSRYIGLFRLPFHIAERLLLRRDAAALRRAYAGKLARAQEEAYVRRFRQPGVLTGGLNWYRALDLNTRIGPVALPTLFVWGARDQALGRVAAEATRVHVTGPYTFEPLPDATHWLLEEAPDEVAALLLAHLAQWR